MGWRVRWVAAVAAVLLVLVACGGGAGEPESAGTGAQPTPSGPQELAVGVTQDAYEQQEPEANVAMYPTNANVFEGLVRMDSDYEIQPVLATSWEFREPNTWRFELREGVTFHNGEPFTAEAVKYSFDRIAEAGGGTLRIDENSTEIIDEHTVEVTPTVENRRMVEQLVHPENSILAPGTSPAEEPVGTGPFRFVSYTPDEQIVVERNDDYWGEAPILERITFRFLPDTNARRLALESGDVDAILEAPLEDADSLEEAGMVVETTAVGAYEAMYANISDQGSGLMQESAVRTAVQLAIDRQGLVEGVYEGVASPEQTMIPARLLDEENAAKISGYDHDPERAARLLDEAGWTMGDDGVRTRDGQRLALELVSGFPSAGAHGGVPEFVQAQLGEIGIAVEIVTAADSPAYTEELNDGGEDLYLEQGSQNDANPAFLPALLFWEEGLFGPNDYQPLFAPGWPEGEEERIGDNEFDTLVEEALAAEDSATARSRTAEAMSLMIDEYGIIVPLAGIPDVNAHSPAVHGFQSNPSGLQIRWDEVFLSG